MHLIFVSPRLCGLDSTTRTALRSLGSSPQPLVSGFLSTLSLALETLAFFPVKVVWRIEEN